MSRRLSLRLVTDRAVDEVPEGLADEESAQVPDQPEDGASRDQPPALGVPAAAAASG